MRVSSKIAARSSVKHRARQSKHSATMRVESKSLVIVRAMKVSKKRSKRKMKLRSKATMARKIRLETTCQRVMRKLSTGKKAKAT